MPRLGFNQALSPCIRTANVSQAMWEALGQRESLPMQFFADCNDVITSAALTNAKSPGQQTLHSRTKSPTDPGLIYCLCDALKDPSLPGM